MSTNLKVRKPKAIIVDVVGTITKSNWIDHVVFPYVRENVDTYLVNNWGKPVLMRDIELLRVESLQDGGPAIARPSEIQEKVRPTVVDYVKRCLAEVLNHEAIRIFNFHMIFDGFNRDKLHTAVYSDAADSIKKWPNDGIEVHVISNGWSYAMKKFLTKTNHSDLTPMIKSYMDTELGLLEDTATFKAVVRNLGLPAEDILFLTHSGMEGVAAHKAGLSVILLATHREDVTRERTDATIQCGLPLARIMTDISFSNGAPVASSMVNEEEMSQAVAASHASRAASAGGSATRVSGSKTALSGSKKGGSATSLSRSKSSSSVGSNSKGSSSASGSHSSTASGSSSALSGSKSSSAVSGSKSSSASSGSKSSSAASGSKSSSAASGSKSSSASSGSKSSSAASGSKSSSAASGSKSSSGSSGSSSKGGSSSASGSKSGSKH